MRIITGITKKVAKGVLLVAVTLAPLSASAMTVVGDLGLVDGATARRIVVQIAKKDTVPTVIWIWRADADGHLVEISGAQLVGAKELVLEDSLTGQVVWHERAQYLMPGDEGQGAEVVHPGVTVQSGRSYRLRAVFARAVAGRALGEAAPSFLVFSKRPVSGVR